MPAQIGTISQGGTAVNNMLYSFSWLVALPTSVFNVVFQDAFFVVPSANYSILDSQYKSLRLRIQVAFSEPD